MSDPVSYGMGDQVGSYLAPSLHSSNEPSELLQWPCHEGSTINIDMMMMIIIIILRSGRLLDCYILYIPQYIVSTINACMIRHC